MPGLHGKFCFAEINEKSQYYLAFCTLFVPHLTETLTSIEKLLFVSESNCLYLPYGNVIHHTIEAKPNET